MPDQMLVIIGFIVGAIVLWGLHQITHYVKNLRDEREVAEARSEMQMSDYTDNSEYEHAYSVEVYVPFWVHRWAERRGMTVGHETWSAVEFEYEDEDAEDD